jgi:hypothetical protein
VASALPSQAFVAREIESFNQRSPPNNQKSTLAKKGEKLYAKSN